MKKACVIGWPISHSRSPLIHGYWIKTSGIAAEYTKVPVRPEDLHAFIASLEANGLNGCNVTIPHKERVFEHVTIADDATARLRAVNTVYRQNGKTYGTNTDGEGFLQSLKAQVPSLVLSRQRAVVLGAGGAAASIVDALLRSGLEEIGIVNRSLERAQALQSRFGAALKPHAWEDRSNILGECTLLVNTTSLGMAGQPPLHIDLTGLPERAVVADIVYTPLQTALLREATARGHHTAEGLGMLLHQAVRGFELWFGIRPSVTDELYHIVAQDIQSGSS